MSWPQAREEGERGREALEGVRERLKEEEGGVEEEKERVQRLSERVERKRLESCGSHLLPPPPSTALRAVWYSHAVAL